MLMIGSMRGRDDFLIIFLCVFDTMRAISLEDGLQGHAAPLLLLLCCSIISASLHLILRQQGGLRQAMTGKKQKAIWPDGGMEDGGGRRGWNAGLKYLTLVSTFLLPYLADVDKIFMGDYKLDLFFLTASVST